MIYICIYIYIYICVRNICLHLDIERYTNTWENMFTAKANQLDDSVRFHDAVHFDDSTHLVANDVVAQ